jgi:6-phosphogluconolactonase
MVFLGCYTTGAGGDGAGIVVARRAPAAAPLGAPTLAGASVAPSYVARHPHRDVLYAVNELPQGRLTAFLVGSDGLLKELSSWPTGGALPCFVTVTPDGAYAVVTNYGSGSVASFALAADGTPTHRADLAEHWADTPRYDPTDDPGDELPDTRADGRDPVRQEGPHAHSVALTAAGVLALDLGLDTVYRYHLDPATGRLEGGDPLLRLPRGTGPRHLVAVGDDVLHVVGELSGTVNTFARTGEQWHLVSSVPSSVSPDRLPSEIAVSADHRFLYVANRGPDTIATFALDPDRPAAPPRPVGEVPTGGRWPRHFSIVDGYLYVANERSDSVVAFALDPVTGLPAPTGDILSTPSPTQVLAWP